MSVTHRERHARLIRAAQQAVAAHGADVRLKDVAASAGLTSGAVKYHFPDVQSLLVEASRSALERFLEKRQEAVDRLDDPAEGLTAMISLGLPTGPDDDDVKLLCALGGAAARHSVYGVLLTSLFDRQVALYQVILETGAARGQFELSGSSRAIGRNLVALEDAYSYRIIARHASIEPASALGLILDYARLATGHPLTPPHSKEFP